MSDTYTKLFSSITESTVWGESYSTRIVWVTMLAMADAKGAVYGAVPGLARRANVTLQEVEQALAAFMAPDAYSRTRDEDGRRIEEIDGGWRLINHAKYSAVRNAEERREYKRQWDREHRPSGHARSKDDDSSPSQSDASPTNADKSDRPDPTSTNTNTRQEQKPRQKTAPDGDLLSGISPEVAADFKALRSKLRAPITATAMKGIRREAAAAGLSLEAALVMCCERGWRGFKAEWLSRDARAGPSGQPQPSRQAQGVAAILGVNANDLIADFNRPVVSVPDRTVPGELVPAEPRRLPGR